MTPTKLPPHSQSLLADTNTRRLAVAKFSRHLSLRIGAILILAGLLVSSFYSSSSASRKGEISKNKSSEVAQSTATTSPETKGIPEASLPASRAALSLLPLPIPPPPGETIETFATDCTTPKTAFEVGETVCVKVSGVPTGSFFPHRVLLGNANSTVIQSFDVTTDPQTFSFVVNATSVIGAVTVDNRGSWQAVVRNPFFYYLEAASPFTVTDPANFTADVGVAAVNSPGTVQADTAVTFELQLKNYGPDSSATVELTNAVPANTTFVDFQQISGPTFTCTTPSVGSTGTTTCTITSVAWPGPAAEFVATYQVLSGTAANTEIANTATVTSTTNDQNTLNNSSTDIATVVAAPAGTACSFTCPSNIVATATSSSGAIVTFASAINVDGDCGSISASPSSGSQFPVGVTTVNVSSESGPSCSFTVTVVDTPDPSISCPVDKIATADGSGFATVAVGAPTTNPSTGVTVVGRRSDDMRAVYDENGNLVTPEVIVPLTDPYPIGTTGITWTVTDEFGRTATCTQRVVVHAPCASDTQAPTITAPADITVGTGPNSTTCGVVLDDELGQAEFTDDCSAVLSVSGVPAGNLFPIGTTVVTYTATDGAGHSASDTQTIVVTDNTPPAIAAPADASYVCTSEVPAADPSQAHGTNPDIPGGGPVFDNCGTPTVTVSESSSGAGSAASPLIITRTFTATDSHGNSASAIQTITVIDPTPPTITLNGANPQIVECHTSYTDQGATAHDNCSADFAATPSGAVDANTVGTYTVTYNASDAAGNAADPVTRTVIVQDTTAPVITLNEASQNPQYVECHTSYTELGATATDGCSGSFAATPSGSVDANTVGTYTITYNATDPSGNNATAITRTVIVQDTIAPTITLNTFAPSMWPPNHKYSTFQLTQFVTGATDSCNTSLGLTNVVIEKVTSDELENSGGDGNTFNDIVIAADCKSVQLRSERNGGGNGRVYTITFKATDASGNVGRATAKVVVPHNPGETAVDSGVQYTVNGSCP